jgi:lysophospholipid acyltransferase (LPLAT)-like uncharacterized protein
MSEEIACSMNIGPRGRRRRMGFGVVTLAVTAGIAVALVVMHVDRWWRLALFLPYVSAATGFFQAREKT